MCARVTWAPMLGVDTQGRCRNAGAGLGVTADSERLSAGCCHAHNEGPAVSIKLARKTQFACARDFHKA